MAHNLRLPPHLYSGPHGTRTHKVYSQTAEVYNKSNKTKLKSESH